MWKCQISPELDNLYVLCMLNMIQTFLVLKTSFFQEETTLDVKGFLSLVYQPVLIGVQIKCLAIGTNLPSFRYFS